MSIGTILSIALAVLRFVNWLTARIDREELKGEVKLELIAEQSLLLTKRFADAEAAKKEVASWSTEQLDDYLSQP